MNNNTRQIWDQHFGDSPSVSLKHENIESFFEALNQDCLREDELNRIGENMRVIAKELSQDFSGKWYQCKSCSAHNLNDTCKGCGSTDMDQLSIANK